MSCEEGEEAVELVGQRHRHRRRRCRHFIALPDRLVMIADRVGDRVGLALRLGKIAADHALELGELADHAGDEVGLRQPRGAFGLVRQFHSSSLPRKRESQFPSCGALRPLAGR